MRIDKEDQKYIDLGLLKCNSLEEELEKDFESIFWDRDKLQKEYGDIYNEENLIFDKNMNIIRPLVKKELTQDEKGNRVEKYAVRVEHADRGDFKSREELEKIAREINAEHIMYFIYKGQYGGEYSFLLNDKDVAKEIGNKYDQNAYGLFDNEGKCHDVLLKENLKESKQDELNLRNHLQDDHYTDLFLKLRNTFKSPYNDLYYWIKREPQELFDYINKIQTERQTKKDTHSKNMEGAKLLGEEKGFKVYHVTTWESSKTLGLGTKWCISMENDAYHWNKYTNEDKMKFYFFISSSTKYALALYPKTLEVNKFISQEEYLSKTNFEIYNPGDHVDYSVINKLPLDLIPEELVLDIKIYLNGLKLNEDGTILLKANKELETCEIPNSVKSIGYRAFDGCNNLTSIDIPDGVTSIGGYAFFGCSNLTNITIPDSVKSIEYAAFGDCLSLTNITIPNSVTEIGDFVFASCYSLTSITIPNSVTSIGKHAFANCLNLIITTNNEYVIDYCQENYIKYKYKIEESALLSSAQNNSIRKLENLKESKLDNIKKQGKKLDGHGNVIEEDLQEDIEKHDILNPKLWNEDGTLKEEVHDKILEIVDDFLEGLKNDGIKFNLKDVKIVGSNCSYNYTDKSDLDVHLVMDTNSLKCPDNLYPLLYSAYRSIYNKARDIDFYGIPVEIFVETEDVPQIETQTLEENKKGE